MYRGGYRHKQHLPKYLVNPLPEIPSISAVTQQLICGRLDTPSCHINCLPFDNCLKIHHQCEVLDGSVGLPMVGLVLRRNYASI